MNTQRALAVVLLGALILTGCESEPAAAGGEPLPQQTDNQLAETSTSTQTPMPSASLSSPAPTPTASVTPKVNGQGAAAPEQAHTYSLDDIVHILHSESNVFHIFEAPNKQAVAYMVSSTGSDYEDLTLHIWNVGETKPRSSQEEPEGPVGDVFWSPNSDYVFVDSGTYVTRRGDLYSAATLKMEKALGYLQHVYFSPDGKYLTYSDSTNTSEDTIKSNYLDPGEPFNLVVYDVAAHQETTLFKGTGSMDYIANGWLDSNTISYRTNSYSADGENLHELTTKYKYMLDSKTSTLDTTQKKPTTEGDYDKMRDALPKGIFDRAWSPDRGVLVYAVGDEKEKYGSVWMWRLGEDKPVQVGEEQMLGEILWSNDSHYFMFDSGMSSEEEVHIVDAQTGNVQTVQCFRGYQGYELQLPYFSGDSRYLLFSSVEDLLPSSYKNNTETGNSHNVSLLELATGKIQVLFHPDDKLDYVPLGWSGERKFMYKKTNFQTNESQIAEYDVQG